MSHTHPLSLSLVDGILTVRLARPEVRNAQTPSLWRELAGVGAHLDPDVCAVVLSAEGPSFSAGLDRGMLTAEGVPGEGSLIELARLPAAQLDATLAGYQEAFRWWREAPVVTVAAVGGHAIGAGFQLALACDLIVAADDAQFAMREVGLGLVPDLGGTQALLDAVGYSRAMDLVLSGRTVDADEAVRIGLAQRRVPRADLESAAHEVARSCSAGRPDVVASAKALLRGAAHRADGWATHDAQMAAERSAQAERIRELVAHPIEETDTGRRHV